MCGKEGDQYKCGVDVIMNDLDCLRQRWETNCDEECWLNDNVNNILYAHFHFTRSVTDTHIFQDHQQLLYPRL